MLVFSRKVDQSIAIGDDVRVVVVEVQGDRVKLGIEAPRHTPVHRCEILPALANAGESDPGKGKRSASGR